MHREGGTIAAGGPLSAAGQARHGATVATGLLAARRPAGLQSARVVGDATAVVDFVLIVLASLVAKEGYIGLFLESRSDNGPYLAAGIFVAAIAVTVFRNQKLYTFEILTRFRGQTGRIVMGLAVSALGLLTAGYLLKMSAVYSRGWMVSWFALNLVSIALFRFVVSRFLQRWIAAGLFRRRIAVYGSGDIAVRLIEHLGKADDRLQVVGVFDDLAKGAVPRTVVAGGLSDLISAGQTAEIDEVLIALPLAEVQRISNLVMQLSVLPADIRLCPDLAAFHMRPLGMVDYGGVSMMELVRRPLDGWGPIVKSVEDRVIAGILLIAAAPLMLLIALAVKLDSRGPVFFRQRRHGFNHVVISVRKFRTMYVAEDGPVVPQATQDDPRVTRVGRFLRRTSLDELPQLINVLLGDMSLVGPRPHALVHNEYYSALLQQYACRHKMKPGITGWAQINGYRGETDTPEKMRLRMEFDLYYIENWSLWFDLRIIFLTPFLGFVGRNAF